MKKVLLIIFLTQVNLILAQSKKNQIEQLQFTNDSLIRVIEFARKTNEQKLQELNAIIVNAESGANDLKKSIDSLDRLNENLNSQIILKSAEIDSINKLNTANEKKIKSLEETNSITLLKITQLENQILNKIECVESEESNSDNIDSPKLISSCTFRNIKIIKVGIANERNGIYSYSYEYFKDNRQIKPSEIFNLKITELESMLNDKFNSHFIRTSKDPSSENCFDDIVYENVTFNGEQIEDYRFNQIDIDFSSGDNTIIFTRSFGLPGACFALDSSSLVFSISELEPYFAK